MLAGWAALACACCVSAPSARQVVDARLDSPRQTLEAFQTFLRADLLDQEYRCFSASFLRSFEPPISFFTYAEARDRLAREQPWFKLFATAEVVSEESLGERRHGLIVEVAGRTWRVNMVREDFFRIRWSEGAEEGGRAALENLVRIDAEGPAGPELAARLPLVEAERDLARLSSATVERLWKIDSVEPLGP